MILVRFYCLKESAFPHFATILCIVQLNGGYVCTEFFCSKAFIDDFSGLFM